ncbi:MAG: methionyl-tRNA formyltransferase [Xanthomonadaceae bacterium]|nr:methionyl-tRNA formyltransferase [Xanthomonadaceae bacterium]
MRLVFAGSPAFALPALRVAASLGELVAVYTQPDRPAGRGRQLAASPVKQAAQDFGVPVHQPASLRGPEAREEMRQLSPDLMIVVAYGLILPRAVLAIPRLGCWNVHASLLPRWRGAAPIQRAIEAGDGRTGVCLMQMEAGPDTGPVLLSLETPIADDETAGSLHDRLAELGAEVLSDGLKLLRAGLRPQPVAQSESGVSHARKLDKAEAAIDWARPAVEIDRKIRALHPWPVAEADLAGQRLRVHEARVADGAAPARPGTVLAADAQGIVVACAEGAIRLIRVQRAGGRPVSAADYLNAHPELRTP